jgi:hypothetical protein
MGILPESGNGNVVLAHHMNYTMGAFGSDRIHCHHTIHSETH